MLDTSALSFDPVLHRYWLDGQRIPNITLIIDWMNDYSKVPPDLLERKKRLGDAVHIATMLSDRDDLIESSVHTEVLPYLNAWRRFILDTGFVPHLIEQRVYSRQHWYAGTLDRTGLLPAKGEIVLEQKTTAELMPSTGPQTAAQRECLRVMGHPNAGALPRYALQLCPDRPIPYRLEPLEDPNDLVTFLSALNCYNWREKYAKR